MLKNINNYFEDVIDDRIIDIGKEVTRNNKQIENLRNDCFDLWDKIIKALPNEDRKLIFRYEEKRNHEEMLYFRIIYKQGLIDGLRLGNISNEMRNKDIAGL